MYPPSVTVPTNIFLLVANPYKSSFASVTGCGVDQKYDGMSARVFKLQAFADQLNITDSDHMLFPTNLFICTASRFTPIQKKDRDGQSIMEKKHIYTKVFGIPKEGTISHWFHVNSRF